MAALMKAVRLASFGGPEQLSIGQIPRPSVPKNGALIKVKATALNRADILQRKGKYPPPPGEPETLGLEVAGVVEEIGTDCSSLRKGDRVCALLGGGGYAQYCVVPEKMAMQIPEGYSFEEAAAIPEAYLTAYLALRWLGELKTGERVLLHAGASGVSTAAIQLAALKKCDIIVTAGSEEKIEFCKSLGARHGVNYKKGPWLESVLEHTNRKGVDVLVDYIGAPYLQQNISALALDGRMVVLAGMGGMKLEQPLDISAILVRRLKIMGSTLRSRPSDFKEKLTTEFWRESRSLFEERQLLPIIDRIFDWNQVAEAHKYMEADSNKGKIVLRISD